MLKKRTILAVILVVAVAAASAWFYQASRASASVNEKEMIEVARVDFPQLVSATGIIEAEKSVSVGPPQIRNERRFKLARMIDEGKEVQEGDFLVEFDGSDLSRRLRDATANYQRVQEEYQKKRSDYDIQMRELKLQLEQTRTDYEKLENKLSQQRDLESAIVVEETAIRRDTAKRRLDLMEQKLKQQTESGRLDLEISKSNESHYKGRMDDLMDAMDSLTVRAPVTGVVIHKRDFSNEPRQIGSFVFSMDSVMEIPDLSTLRVKVMVDEVDAGRIKPGQEARVQVDALQGSSFSGTVRDVGAILKQASYDRPQKITESLVYLQGEDIELLRPGMSARVQIQVGWYPQVIAIPLSSIKEREGRSFVQVWQEKEKNWEWREIELLTNDGLSAVVKSGLEASEKIRSKPKA